LQNIPPEKLSPSKTPKEFFHEQINFPSFKRFEEVVEMNSCGVDCWVSQAQENAAAGGGLKTGSYVKMSEALAQGKSVLKTL
jgi:hypothetical protein